nr:hypothetical protein [uncultured Flavobacterium sp.]
MDLNYMELAILAIGLLLIVSIYYFIVKSSEKKQFAKRLKHATFYQEEIKQKRQATPQILQAYERLTILMERIDLPKLLSRVQPISELKQDYANFLIQNVDQEFDFNLSQQLYVSDESWALVLTAKNTVIQEILKTSLNEKVIDANSLRLALLSKTEQNSVVDLAKNRLRKEVGEMI